MGKKISAIIFIVLFFLMIAVPFTATFFQHEEVATEQNRRLARPPVFVAPPYRLNPSFTTDLEDWVNDHIGFRSFFAQTNGIMHIALFHRFPPDRPLVFGPKGELNYATFETMLDYQHKNRYPKEYLLRAAESLSGIDRFLKERGTKLYYYQCWDKHSIYPEYFPSQVLQYGALSKTEELLNTFEEKTEAAVISPKKELIEGKSRFETYSVFGDPTHWTQRGAYLGYRKLMDAINRDFPQKYPLLSEEDYEIRLQDMGLTLFGRIHREDLLERFEIKEPHAVQTREKLLFESKDKRSAFYTNPAVENDTRLVIIGDSYFYYYILDDLAESFHETLFFWGDHLPELAKIEEVYHPDILVIENAEREDRTSLLIEARKSLDP